MGGGPLGPHPNSQVPMLDPAVCCFQPRHSGFDHSEATLTPHHDLILDSLLDLLLSLKCKLEFQLLKTYLHKRGNS